MPLSSSPKDKRPAFFCSFWICSRLTFPLISSRKSSIVSVPSGFPRSFLAYSCTSLFFRRWDVSATDSKKAEVSDGCPRILPERKDCSRIPAWLEEAVSGSPSGSISGFSVQCSAIRLSDGQTKSLLDETPPPSLTEEGIISPCSSSNESFGFFRGSFLSVRSSGFLEEREKGTSSACFGKIRSSRSLWLTRTVSPVCRFSSVNPSRFILRTVLSLALYSCSCTFHHLLPYHAPPVFSACSSKSDTLVVIREYRRRDLSNLSLNGIMVLP